MPVVQVRVMRVAMRPRGMTVSMRVRLGWRARQVVVIVMHVVHMPVLMLQLLVHMLMVVTLAEM